MEDIILEEVYPYSVEQVWEALTDPAALAEWLMPGDFKPVVGHRLEFRCTPHGDFDGVIEVEVLHVDKPRKLSYSWKGGDIKIPTVVTYTLTPLSNGGTKLCLEHTGFTGENGRSMHPLLKQGWPGKLKTDLARVLSGIGSRKA